MAPPRQQPVRLKILSYDRPMHGGSFRNASAPGLLPSYLLKWRCRRPRRPHLFSRENASPSHHRQSTAPDSPVFFSSAVPNLYLFPRSTSSPRLPLSPPSAATSAVAPHHWTPFPPSRSLPALTGTTGGERCIIMSK